MDAIFGGTNPPREVSVRVVVVGGKARAPAGRQSGFASPMPVIPYRRRPYWP